MADCFQNRVYSVRYRVLSILVSSYLFYYMAPSIVADHAPASERIIGYICTNKKCKQSFTDLFAYNQHQTHTRNVGTLCASLTMRREIVATRHTGVTTSVVRDIPIPKGEQHFHAWKNVSNEVRKLDQIFGISVESHQFCLILNLLGLFDPPTGVNSPRSGVRFLGLN